MILKKTVSENGGIEVTVNGETVDANLSRKLTGTDGESGAGVFENTKPDVEFWFGNFHCTILFGGTYDVTWQMEDLAPAIFARIKKVREWVEDCRNSGGERHYD